MISLPTVIMSSGSEEEEEVAAVAEVKELLLPFPLFLPSIRVKGVSNGIEIGGTTAAAIPTPELLDPDKLPVTTESSERL